MKNKAWGTFFIKLAFSALIVFLLLKYNTIDLTKVKTALNDGQLVFVLMSLIGVALIFNSYRWMKILLIQKVSASFLPCLKFSVIGIFFNFIIPSSVGGDLVKAIMAATKWGEAKTKILFSAFIDRLFGLAIMMSVCVAGYFMNFKTLNELPEVKQIVLITSGILALLVVGILVSHFIVKNNIGEKLISKIKPVLNFSSELLNHKFDVFGCILMSLGSTLAHILFYYSVFVFFGIPIPISILMFCVPVGTVITALPIAPAGVGVGQAVFFYMFNIFDSGMGEIAFLAVTILQIMYFAWAIIGAIIFSLTPIKLDKLKEVK